MYIVHQGLEHCIWLRTAERKIQSMSEFRMVRAFRKKAVLESVCPHPNFLVMLCWGQWFKQIRAKVGAVFTDCIGSVEAVGLVNIH